MSSIVTQAIVLRHANYGESDRMLTLLSPNLGLLPVGAKGCRKSTSKNMAATELFVMGEYTLYQKGEHFTLTSFHLQENFYALRIDIDKLAHGSYWLSLCEAAALPGESCERLFKMLILSLLTLTYGEMHLRPLTAVFLMQFAILQGFEPQLNCCVRCGKPVGEPIRFDVQEGGVCCGKCDTAGVLLSETSLAWLREAQSKGAFVLAGRRALPMVETPETAEAPFQVMRSHVEHRLEKHITSSRFL